MIYVTVSGNVGRDAELRQAGGTDVLNFNVAATSGFGEREQTLWVRCALWGKRGASLAQYIKKGSRVTVIGELSTEEYNGATQLNCRVAEIKLQDSAGGQQPAQASSAPQQQTPQAPQAPSESLDFDDDVPF